MLTSDRRTFLKTAAVAPLAVSIGLEGCARHTGDVAGPLAPDLLRAVADAVLPAELGAEGTTRAVALFQQWLAEYTPGAELLHGYGTGEIRTAPEDPTERWNGDLEALDAASREKGGVPFADLAVADRQIMIRRTIADERSGRLGNPLSARHVAVALMAHFYRSPEATNLCYRAAIDPFACRPLADSPNEPGPR